ncbi:MAG: hypothetical protein IPH33_00225 [Bacteroidetes bacterium]|nr:hypothetical protein [Bacteroidota bacterium]MBK7429955.1 hypothetical protein [Bacteroidota bacterium]
MKTRNLLILIAFVVSLGFNVYSFNSGAQEVSPCDNTNRYINEVSGGGMEVAKSEIEQLVAGYRQAHIEDPTPYKTTGFILSKRIFDELFKDGDVNALSLNLIVDKDQLNIAVKSIKTTKTGIDKKTGSGLYILQTFCPDDCSAW